MSAAILLSELKAEVERLANKIGAPSNILPTYGRSEDGGRPHIEVDARGYHYVMVERGEEWTRLTTSDIDELLQKIFCSVTFGLASKYELKHRVPNMDSRRLLFQRQVDLLEELSPHWAKYEAERQKSILQQRPYDDHVDARLLLSAQVGWKKACEAYPLPIPDIGWN
jgi:hypothetical protein